jgi:hypothetical protein
VTNNGVPFLSSPRLRLMVSGRLIGLFHLVALDLRGLSFSPGIVVFPINDGREDLLEGLLIGEEELYELDLILALESSVDVPYGVHVHIVGHGLHGVPYVLRFGQLTSCVLTPHIAIAEAIEAFYFGFGEAGDLELDVGIPCPSSRDTGNEDFAFIFLIFLIFLFSLILIPLLLLLPHRLPPHPRPRLRPRPRRPRPRFPHRRRLPLVFFNLFLRSHKGFPVCNAGFQVGYLALDGRPVFSGSGGYSIGSISASFFMLCYSFFWDRGAFIGTGILCVTTILNSEFRRH